MESWLRCLSILDMVKSAVQINHLQIRERCSCSDALHILKLKEMLEEKKGSVQGKEFRGFYRILKKTKG